MMPNGIKVPVGFIRRYWRLLSDAYVNYYGTVEEKLEGKSFDGLVSITAGILKIDEAPVREALVPYYGQIVTQDMLDLLAFKMAGGRTRMIEGKQLSTKLTNAKPLIWLAVLVADCELVPRAGQNPKIHATLIVSSGEYAGVRFEIQVPFTYWVKIFPSVVGFPKWSTPNEREMVQMYFMGQFDLRDLNRITLLETGSTPNMEATNRKLRAKRNLDCVESFTQLCHHCSLGYSGRNMCSRACRPKTLVSGKCSRCGNIGLFTPGKEHLSCTVCTSASLKSYRQRVFA